MTEIQFGRLQDLPLREAWKHEAHQFTPWLAENIDHLSDALGLDLELTGTEVAVDRFSADIVAHDARSESTVLIENQLEISDRHHLGQIMTYVAGVAADTVVWIAPRFEDAHLAAVQWLNENTREGFSFFAVRLRVVRIGDSPFAPIFEVVEKPNDWVRQVKTQKTAETNAYYDIKQSFWTQMIDRHPDLADLGFRKWRYSNNYVEFPTDPVVQISAFFGKAKSGLFVRSAWGQPPEPAIEMLARAREQLEADTGAKFAPTARGWMLCTDFPKGHENTDAWPEIMDWLRENLDTYRAALTRALAAELDVPK